MLRTDPLAPTTSLVGASMPRAHRRTRTRPRPTSRFERLLLTVTILLVPFQDDVPAIGRVSIVWVAFAFMAGVVIFRRPADLFYVAMHRALLPVYGFLVIGALIELTHPHARAQDWLGCAQMVLGGIVVAAICRDRRAIMTVMNAIIAAGVILTFMFAIVAYGPLKNTSAASFKTVSQVRKEALAGGPLGVGVNAYAVVMAEGAAVATALAIASRNRRKQYMYCGFAMWCLLGTFLSLSRGGVSIAVVSIIVLLLSHKRQRLRTMIAVGVLATIFVAVVPSAVFARLAIREGPGRAEPRRQLYLAALDNLPEFAVSGVGAGNFWNDWGFTHEFADKPGVAHPQGVHNSFLQIGLYWGILGLGAYLVTLWALYRGLPRSSSDQMLLLGLRAIAAAMFMSLFFAHTFDGKQFSFALGVLVAERIWLRNQRTAQKAVVPLAATDQAGR